MAKRQLLSKRSSFTEVQAELSTGKLLRIEESALLFCSRQITLGGAIICMARIASEFGLELGAQNLRRFIREHALTRDRKLSRAELKLYSEKILERMALDVREGRENARRRTQEQRKGRPAGA